jgi:multiple sugar transport system permease protein
LILNSLTEKIRLFPLLVRENVFAIFLLLPCFLFVVVFAFYPILYSFYLSLHKIILTLPGLEKPFIWFNNYKQLLHDKIAIHSLINTFIFVFVSTFFEILFGLIIALVINEYFMGKGIVRAAVLIPWAIPTVVASQMWRFIFNDNYGLLNFIFFGKDSSIYRAWLAEPLFAFIAIVSADIWKTSSFTALIILAGLQTIPDEIYEAAKIDGAGAWQRFTRITLPLLKPALLIALLFRTMDAFRVFDLVFVMTQGGPADSTNVLQFYGYKKIFTEGLMGYGSTISVLVFIITFVISLLYIRIIGINLFKERA